MARAKLKATLVMCNVPTSNSVVSRRFYSVLFGSDDFVRGLNDQVESYYRPVSEDGIDLTITQRHDDRESMTCYFAVENLQQTIDELRGRGGSVIVEPTEVAVSGPKKAIDFYRTQSERRGERVSDKVGRMAIMLDPDGNHVGLIQLEEHAERHFRAGKFQRPLGKDQLEELDQAIMASSLFRE